MIQKFPILVFILCLILVAPAFCGCSGVSWWLHLEEPTGGFGTNFTDMCDGNDFVRQTTTEQVSGLWIYGQSFKLADSDYASMSNMSSLVTGSRSWRAVYKPASTATAQWLVGDNAATLNGANLDLYADPLFHCLCGTGAAFIDATSTTSAVVGNWYDVVCVYDVAATNLSVYVNGSYEDSAIGACNQNGGTRVRIGTYTGMFPANGVIDETFYVDDRALNVTEILNLLTYNSFMPPPILVGCSIILVSPVSNANQTNATPTFAFNPVCDGVSSRCFVTVDGAQSGDNSSDIVNASTNYIVSNSSLSNGAHQWNISCGSNTSLTRTLNLWTTNNMSFSGILINGVSSPSLNPTEAGNTIVTASFNVTDDSGAGNIFLAASWTNETNDSITNTSCAWSGYASGNTKGIACQLAMPYYISGGLKTVQVYAADVYGWSVNDSGHNFSYNTIYVVSLNSSTLSMGVFNPGTTWNLATQAQRLTNTGNGAVNVSITGAHLVNGTYVWGIGNFSVSSIPGPPLAMNLTTGSQNYSPVGGILVNATYDVWYLVDATASIPARAYSAVWQWVTSAA